VTLTSVFGVGEERDEEVRAPAAFEEPMVLSLNFFGDMFIFADIVAGGAEVLVLVRSVVLALWEDRLLGANTSFP